MKTIVFQGKTYKTQKQFSDYVNERLSEVKCGFVEEGEDFVFLHELYKRHPNYNVNIDRFHIVPLCRGGQEISRVFEGVYDTFSKHSCIKQQTKSMDAKMKVKAREAISYQVQDVQKGLGKHCVLCNSTENLQVDHYPRLFKDLLKDFGGIGVSFNKVTNDYEYINQDQVKEWQKFHEQRAGYRLLCGNCNVKTYHDLQTV